MNPIGLEYMLMGAGWSQEGWQRDIKGRWKFGKADRGDFQGPPILVIHRYIKIYPQNVVI